MSCEKEFSEKVILITGASSGIGAETAIHFSKLGASVAITGRNLENLKKTEQQCIQPDTPKPLVIQADITKEEDVKRIMEKTISHFGRLDVLVNNAGIGETDNIENASLEQFDRIFNTNVRSIFQLTQLAIPHLKTTKGNIVNVSSISGIRSFEKVIVYSMSKSALDQFTRCAALHLAQYQVRVNSVNPGTVFTNIVRRPGMSETQVLAFLENVKTAYPLGRIGTTIDVTNAIIFLAGDKASYITGVLLPIDSGRHITVNNFKTKL